MGDPGARATCARLSSSDGTWMIVEPRRRPAGGQSQSVEPDVLRRLDDDLRADLAGSARRDGLGAQAGDGRLSSPSRKADFGTFAKRRRRRSTSSWRLGRNHAFCTRDRRHGEWQLCQKGGRAYFVEKWAFHHRRLTLKQRDENADHACPHRAEEISTCLRHAPPGPMSLR